MGNNMATVYSEIVKSQKHVVALGSKSIYLFNSIPMDCSSPPLLVHMFILNFFYIRLLFGT